MKLVSLLFSAAVALSICGAGSASAFAASDPRIVINAVNTPGTPGATYVISAPGSYYLDQNLIGEIDKDGILVNASRVQIDLMGFSILGAGGSLAAVDGIASSGALSDIAVSNGFIAGWNSKGISLTQSTRVRIRDVDVALPSIFGITVGADSVVERCNIAGVGIGISGGNRMTIVDCRVRETADGIYVLQGSIVRNCTVSACAGIGIYAGANSLVANCTVTENNEGITTDGALIVDCIVSDNDSTGVWIFSGTGTVRGCEITGNGSHGIQFSNHGSRAIGNRIASNGGDGIFASAGARIEQNDIRSHDKGAGIRSLGKESMVLACTVTENYIGIVAEKALIVDCTVNDNTSIAVRLGTGTVRGCEISSNGGHGIQFDEAGGRAIANRVTSNGRDGILAEAGARIEENDVRWHVKGAGIRTLGTGSFVVKNSLFGNASVVSVPNSGNFVGPLVFVNAVYGRNEPWANIHGN